MIIVLAAERKDGVGVTEGTDLLIVFFVKSAVYL